MKFLATATATVIALLATSAVFAGDVRDFETRMRAAYADYRSTALFATNSGKVEPSAKAVDAFTAAWRLSPRVQRRRSMPRPCLR